MKRKYISLVQELTNDIESGRFRPGKPLPTEIELSNQHGISRNSVRKALEQLVKDGFVRKVKGVGSFVIPPEERGGVQNLKQRQILFLVFAETISEETFFDEHSLLPKINGINNILAPNGFNLLFSYIGLDKTPPPALLNNDVSGVIFYGSVGYDFWKKYISPHPNVGMSFRDPLLPTNWVEPDYEALGFLAVEHLYSLGHRRIAFVSNECDMYYSQARMNGYINALKRLGLPVRDEYLITWQRERQNGILMREYEDPDYSPYLSKAFQNKTERPTACVCMDNWRAMCTIRALKKMGLAVPNDVSVLGSFVAPQALFLDEYNLTGFSCRMSEVSAQAASLLLGQLLEPENNIPRTILVRPEFHQGTTTSQVKQKS